MVEISVVIPTYNRFKYLLNTIKSVKDQTYTNTEIIVVNDRSSQKEYYEYDWEKNGIIIVHLEQNTKTLFGFGCPGYVRNMGIRISKGKYIAFCDDDDIWLPNKLELQINAMINTGCKMSSTDGFLGHGVYNEDKIYKKYNAERHYPSLLSIYKRNGSDILDNGFPDIWDLKFLRIHNCIICSSVMIEKEILSKINNFKHTKPPGEDYDCWLRALQHTNSVYVKEPCFYYDSGHGDGRNY